jgi:hypothetical protein
MFFFKSEKNKIEYKILFDFRNSSLAFALLKKEGEEFLILESERKYFYFTKIENPNLYIETFYDQLKIFCNKIIKKNPALIKENLNFEILLGSPWYDCKIKNFSLNENKEKKINKFLLNNIIEKNILIDSEHKLIENKIINLKINGYAVENPLDKKFKQLDFHNYQSFVAKNTEKDITKILKDNFHHSKINWCTHPIVLFVNFKNYFNDLNNFLIFDVGGEITEMTQVIQNRIKNIYTIPVGTNNFLRKLTNNFNYELNLAFSKMEIYNEDHIDTQNNKENIIFNEFKKEWLENIKEVFEKHKTLSNPSNILIISDQKFQKITKKIIDDPSGWANALKNNRKPETTIIDNYNILKEIKYKNSEEKDTVLSLFTNYLIINS